ncbi:hypothetical protein [Companilactobacillus halodurans]|uniref:Uncharacterized protein n=1 Tax=Companilactobacillus halodurans TaxID=2584183 RepID=A0A5P0ZMU2_9LACO|nr:hypothetical protein [Companilactobacillus halodurans]MQS75543.1 hypothetical protein [Companilactobacillus halodurans]
MLSTEILLSDLSLSRRPDFLTIPGFGIGLKLRPVRSSIHKAERTTKYFYQDDLSKPFNSNYFRLSIYFDKDLKYCFEVRL